MKAWFYGLQTRERWIVAIGAGVAALIVVWGFVVRPLGAEVARLQASVEMKQRLLIDVSRLETGPSRPAEGQQDRDQPLYLLVNNTVGTYGLAEPRARANGPSGVDVTLQNASFDAIVAWLVALHSSYGVDVETAQLAPTREPGFVNATLLLRRL